MKVKRELQWYKEVERTVPSSYILLANRNGETPSDLFSNYHYNLVKEGEQWMRDTAGSFTIVAALIVTVMFAAAFTLPGGTEEKSGNPKFLQRNSFMVFILSDAISLFSSVTVNVPEHSHFTLYER
ncbi:ankyrin repeat-containing protein ITN1-like [Cornus florida]|uniref:ankyrin repeat-containing protein ITN1-like n=1 Tax=Cornus florida TaxID=4283 RepID=UPI00289DD9C0|nr:ankyrin repeat-containing protein ITN1-like [Cornus florida]